MDDLKKKGGYWKLKEAALDRTVSRICFGRGYGPVVRQTTECINNNDKAMAGYQRIGVQFLMGLILFYCCVQTNSQVHLAFCSVSTEGYLFEG
jgi:hypothetical protein